MLNNISYCQLYGPVCVDVLLKHRRWCWTAEVCTKDWDTHQSRMDQVAGLKKDHPSRLEKGFCLSGASEPLGVFCSWIISHHAQNAFTAIQLPVILAWRTIFTQPRLCVCSHEIFPLGESSLVLIHLHHQHIGRLYHVDASLSEET